MSKIKLLLDVVEDMRKLSDSIQTIADSIAGNTPEAETDVPDSPAENTPHITLEQVRAVLADASGAGKTKQVKELLRKHGAEKLSGILPENYSPLMEEVAML